MRKILLLLGFLAFLPCVEADSGRSGLIYRVLLPLEEVELTFDVVQNSRDGVGFREASLSCVGTCDGFIPYAEETLDNILSVEFDSDERNLMFVTWVTGSAYRVQAFSVSGRGFEARLDTGSRAPPAVLSFSGQTILILLDSQGKSGDFCLRQMEWNGSAFIARTPAEATASKDYRVCQDR